MTTHTIAVKTHGRYLIHAPTDKPVGTLCGFHGYKENADIHLDLLRRVSGERHWRLISVQALNRFYSKGGDVVASWMTRQDREQAIADNVAYVAAVLHDIAERHGVVRPLVYAGFSQGVGMAYRAAAFAGHPCDGLIVLAGDVPPDVAPVAAQLPKILLGRGTRDEWYTAEKAARDLEVLGGAGADVVEHVFDGGHDWHPSFIVRAGGCLDELSRSTAAR